VSCVSREKREVALDGSRRDEEVWLIEQLSG
jgi:hypothetical protein